MLLLLLVLLLLGVPLAAYELHVAPMVNYTNRHFRWLLRLLSPDAVLWTEMIKTGDLLSAADSKKQAQLLSRGEERGKCVLQLGGDDAEQLRLCSKLAASFHYDELNLNLGCPSIETNARFGANLMRDPRHVAYLLDSMADCGGGLPVSVKCRIGTHDTYKDVGEDRYETLHNFVHQVTLSGAVKRVTVHARSAVLQGLDPSQNRNVPPLRYDFVEAVARDFPGVHVVVNGGIKTINSTMLSQSSLLSGVMVGRALLRRPLDLLLADPVNANNRDAFAASAERAVSAYSRYASSELSRGTHNIQEVLLPLVLVFRSLAEEEEEKSPPRLLKFVMQSAIPVLMQATASAAVLASLEAASRELDHDDDGDRVDGAASKMSKAIKTLLGNKVLSKLQQNVA